MIFLGTITPIAPAGSSSSITCSQDQGSSLASAIAVGRYPPTLYRMPPRVNTLSTAPPPVVDPGAPRDYPRTTVAPNIPDLLPLI